MNAGTKDGTGVPCIYGAEIQYTVIRKTIFSSDGRLQRNFFDVQVVLMLFLVRELIRQSLQL